MFDIFVKKMKIHKDYRNIYGMFICIALLKMLLITILLI